jgi:peptide/nickel transport system substrate-binding protein
MRRVVLGFTVLAMLLAGCSSGESVDVGGDGDVATEDAGDAAAGGTLIAALGGEPDKMDPHTTSSAFAFKVLENVYDTLVQPGDDLQPEPALAEEWEVSDDQLTWTFTLREGVTFHDGSEFDSEDVKASFERIIDEGANAYRFASVESVDAPEPLTVELQLSRPTPNLLTLIGAFKGMAIASADDIGGDFDFAQEANGTGPFTLESFQPGSGVELAAFDDYWQDGLPKLDGVEYRFIPEESVKLTNLQGGEVHWIDTVPPQQVESLEGGEGVEVGRVTGNDYWYMATNMNREPFSDRAVRRAIAYALDPAEIAEAAKFDAATPNETAIPPSSPWYLDYSPYGRDVDEAQRLLEEADQGDGFTMDLMVTNEYPETVTAAQIIADQLSEVGITVEIRTEDFNTWLSEQGEGNFDAFMLGWLGNIDPDDYYYAQHHSEGGFNFQGYDNPEVDDLLDQARQELDEDTRKELYDDAVTMIVDDASYIYFYNPDIVNAWRPEVSGYQTRADNAVRFVETTVSDG